MAVYELFVNAESEVFEVLDESCNKKNKESNKSYKLIDRLDTDTTIEESYKRYYLAYLQRKVIISDCKRK